MKEIHTAHAPVPVGPYAQAVHAGDTLYCSGQVGIDPHTNALVSGGVEEELQQALTNLEAVLTAARCTKQEVVRVELYVTDLRAWDTINKVYGAFFTEVPYPARVTVQVAALPKGATVEVACTAHRAD